MSSTSTGHTLAMKSLPGRRIARLCWYTLAEAPGTIMGLDSKGIGPRREAHIDEDTYGEHGCIH